MSESTLGERIEAMVRAELTEDIRDVVHHEGRQSIIRGLYIEWANHHHRRKGGIPDAEVAELKAHTAGMTDLQKLDAAIDIVTELFGPMDEMKETG